MLKDVNRQTWCKLGEDLPICTCIAITILVVASTRLGSNANTVSNLDSSGNVLAYSDGLANNLVTDANRVISGSPSRSESVII